MVVQDWRMRWMLFSFASPTSGSRVLRTLCLPASLAVTGLAHGVELDHLSSIVPATPLWPWIAGAAIVGLLGVVSFLSRRRIHSVVGS
jgi:hypothetical protein